MESCEFCRKPLDIAPYDTNRAHKACNDRWDWLTSAGLCGKCGKPFGSQEEADMRAHLKCYSDSVPYEGYYDCVQA